MFSSFQQKATCSLFSSIQNSLKILKFQKRVLIIKPKFLTHNIYIGNSSISAFKNKGLNLLKISFEPTTYSDVIPDISTNDIFLPNQYFLPEISAEMLENPNFNVDNLYNSDKNVKTFFQKMHDIIQNTRFKFTNANKFITDAMVIHLLFQILNIDSWPLMVKTKSCYDLFIGDVFVSVNPEFVINKKNFSVMTLKNKQQGNLDIRKSNNYGESQLAFEMLALGDNNNRLNDEYKDQTLFAIRIISTYVTFYKAVIPIAYWEELNSGLPELQSVVIKRWPHENGFKSGINLAEPNGRRDVLTALMKIRQFLLTN